MSRRRKARKVTGLYARCSSSYRGEALRQEKGESISFTARKTRIYGALNHLANSAENLDEEPWQLEVLSQHITLRHIPADMEWNWCQN